MPQPGEGKGIISSDLPAVADHYGGDRSIVGISTVLPAYFSQAEDRQLEPTLTGG